MTDENHIITATEPAWVTAKYKAGSEGAPEYMGGSTEVMDAIEAMMDESSYECSCGASLGSWYDVQEHLQRGEDTDNGGPK